MIESFLNQITPLAIALGGVLGFLAKLLWSREFVKTIESRAKTAEEVSKQLLETWKQRLEAVRDAMQEQLKAAEQKFLIAEKKAESLIELGPVKMGEQFKAMKAFYEEQIASLETRLREAQVSLKKKDEEIEALTVGAERLLRDKLAQEKASYEREISYLNQQIGKLRERENTLILTLELLQRESFQMDLVKQQLSYFAGERTLARIRYERAQRGVYKGIASYMNAQAEAKVAAEKRFKNQQNLEAPLVHQEQAPKDRNT